MGGRRENAGGVRPQRPGLTQAPPPARPHAGVRLAQPRGRTARPGTDRTNLPPPRRTHRLRPDAHKHAATELPAPALGGAVPALGVRLRGARGLRRDAAAGL